MRLLIAAQLMADDGGPDVLGYHHEEIVLPESEDFEAGMAAVAEKMLDRIDEAKESVSAQIRAVNRGSKE